MTGADPRRGLPRLPLYYTLDQVSALLSLSVTKLIESYVWFTGREHGVYKARFLRAVNLAQGSIPQGEHPIAADWRVPEGELLRWLTYNNLWIFDPLAQAERYDQPQALREVKALQAEGHATTRYFVDEQVARVIKNKSNITPEEDPHGGN